MASSSSSAAPQPPPPPPPARPLSHLPCIRAFHLNPASAAALTDLARAVKEDQQATGQDVMLALKTLAEAKTWSAVSISASSWAKVSALRTRLISESDALIPIVTSINPRAIYLYESALVLQLHAGVAPLKSFLTMEQDCGLLVPLSPVPGSAGGGDDSDDNHRAGEGGGSVEVTAWDETRGEEGTEYRLALAEGKAFVLSGTAKLEVQGSEPLVAVVFCLASGSGGDMRDDGMTGCL